MTGQAEPPPGAERVPAGCTLSGMFVTWNDPCDHGHGDFREHVASRDEQQRLLQRLDQQSRADGALTDVAVSVSEDGPHLLLQTGADRATLIWFSADGTSFTSQHGPGDGPPLPDLYRPGDHVRFAESRDLVSLGRAFAAADEFYETGGARPGGITWRPG